MAYAEGTKVPVDKTRTEIEALLKKHGAIRFAYMDEGYRAVIGFFLKERFIKMALPFPTAPPKNAGPNSGAQRAYEQEVRRRWRSMLLIVKAKLEAVENKISTIEREFMADVVMPDGQTAHQWLSPQIENAYSKGEMPSTLRLTHKGN